MSELNWLNERAEIEARESFEGMKLLQQESELRSFTTILEKVKETTLRQIDEINSRLVSLVLDVVCDHFGEAPMSEVVKRVGYRPKDLWFENNGFILTKKWDDKRKLYLLEVSV